MLLVEQLPFNFATIFFSIIGYVSELLIHRPKLVEVVVAVVNSQVYISQLSDQFVHTWSKWCDST